MDDQQGESRHKDECGSLVLLQATTRPSGRTPRPWGGALGAGQRRGTERLADAAEIAPIRVTQVGRDFGDDGGRERRQRRLGDARRRFRGRLRPLPVHRQPLEDPFGNWTKAVLRCQSISARTQIYGSGSFLIYLKFLVFYFR